MDNNFQNYHHQWHPGPFQPNICPFCSAPHFPFCPPYPPPPPPPPPYAPHTPNFPPYPHFPRPAFDSYTGPPIGSHNHYPFGVPRPWQINHSDYRPVVSDYGGGDDGGSTEADRSFKRARVGEIGGGPPGSDLYGNENYQSLNTGRVLVENERRLKLIRDHGCGAGSAASAPPSTPPGNPEMCTAIPGSVDGKRPFLETNQYARNDLWNGVHYNSPVPPPPLPPYGGYFVRPNGEPPHLVSPPPPPPAHPPSHPSLFSVTGNLSAAGNTSSYPQILNAPPSSTHSAMAVRSNRPKVVDASHLLKSPHRVTRPDHFVIILRGLPGSGKSYLAKMLRDIEVENSGSAPRIHSMDDYFMTEVEKVEESDLTPSSSGRSKKTAVKKVMEYCYEPEMEEAYRASMLKAFKRTLEEGVFTFVIVDDRNLRVADFAQFWATAKRSGYEAYILEAIYKDPAGCAARNVHGFTLDQIQKMAGQWEEAPALYMQLDIKSLLRGDDLKENGIQEVEMDMEDDFGLPERRPNSVVHTVEDVTEGSFKTENRWDTESSIHTEEVKELSRSKWSNLEEDERDKSRGVKGNSNSLSASSQGHCKKGKSVWWGDQGGNAGFSIAAARNAHMPSLVIGPGAGYNLKSNPLSEEERLALADSIKKAKVRSVFQDQLRAEHESFKAVFDRRRLSTGELDSDDD